jgi:hypothetical protein
VFTIRLVHADGLVNLLVELLTRQDVARLKPVGDAYVLKVGT